MFTGCMFLLGIFVFATVVGNVGDVISNMNAARTNFQSRFETLCELHLISHPYHSSATFASTLSISSLVEI